MINYIRYEIGDIHPAGEKGQWYMHAFIQGKTIVEVVEQRRNAHNSHGNMIYKVDYAKSKLVKQNYGMSRNSVNMPLVVEKIGYYFDQGMTDET